jgi:hypothetical protein
VARREQPGEVERAVERWATERAVWLRDHAAVEPSQRFVAQTANTGMPRTLRKTSSIRGGARKSRQLIKAPTSARRRRSDLPRPFSTR